MIHVSVIGAGPMGSAIAGELATKNLKVKLYDCVPNKAAMAVRELDERLPELNAVGVVDGFCQFSALVKACSSLKAAVEDSEIVFEAVVEDLAIKRRVFADIARHCSESCVIATNSLTWSASDMAKGIRNPERTLGVRFLHPVFGIRGVEISPTVETSAETRVIVQSFLESLGKKPFFPKVGAPRYVLTDLAARQRRESPGWRDDMGISFHGGPASDVGPGGPGALGTGSHTSRRAPPDSSSPREVYDGPGGPGALGTGTRAQAPYNAPPPSRTQGAGGPGGLGTGPVPSGNYRVQQPSTKMGPGGPGAVVAEQQRYPRSTGHAAEGPGGPGARGTAKPPSITDSKHLPGHIPAHMGPGGPGALGTGRQSTEASAGRSCNLRYEGTVVHGKDSASEWDSQQICVVCMDAKRNALLSPCHHFCVCWKCAGAICGRKGECPVCRQIIREVVQVYVA